MVVRSRLIATSLSIACLVFGAAAVRAQDAPAQPPAQPPEQPAPAPPAPPAQAEAPAAPATPNGDLEQARAAFKAGDYNAASEAAGRVLAVNPESIEANYIAGASLTKLVKFEEALPRLQIVAASNPAFPNLHYWLGYIAYFRAETMAKQGSPAEARPLFIEAAGEFKKELDRLPSHSGSISSRALALLKAGEYDEAIAAHEAWIAAAPQKAEPYLSLGTCYARAGRGADALALLERLPDKEPAALARAALGMAIEFLTGERPADAATLARKAIEIDPSSTRSLAVLAIANCRLGRYDDVASEISQLVSTEAAVEDLEQVSDAVKKALGPGSTTAPGEVPPQVLRVPEPRYPKAALNSNISTEVVVLAQILQDGRVGGTVIVPNRQSKELRALGFETAAFDAVKRGRYKPGTRDGGLADFWQIVGVRFNP